MIEATIKIAGISTGETGDQPLEMNRPPPLWGQAQRGDQVRYGMTERPKPDPNADLHRTLNNACRKWGARVGNQVQAASLSFRSRVLRRPRLKGAS